ncbi:MarR family winged helix-turn-helix transcriptional regulator [Hungatella effluvii]|uniref:MarR family winged helix-turn-helix transcriptional regulator n=1 Tax=Hungatella effluvii TaxID=1096246 RepID=UPI0022E591AF|nr:MarR family winged helix-turn-helix transcriptional regulator [Hungatella effluvii]
MSKLYNSTCYCTNLRRSANAMSEFYDSALKEAELTISQYYLLVNLSRLGKANITHWSERVGLDRSTMVRNIKPLQSRGLIEGAEGHGKTFTLSEKGHHALDTATVIWQQMQEKMEQFLGKEDAGAILRIGSRLQDLKD